MCLGFGLQNLKLHQLDHIVEDMKRFGSMVTFYRSPFERYNVRIKITYRRALNRGSTITREPVKHLNFGFRSDNSVRK